VKKPYYVTFVMGMAFQGALDATPANLISLTQRLPADKMFNCCAIEAAQLPITTLSVLLGGQTRVGMEDNIYYSGGVLGKNNAQ
jgi:3-keto-5-aminohexanoate cleavage enzyme